jgi:hypothetical protein
MKWIDVVAMGGSASVHIDAQPRPDDPVQKTRWQHGETGQTGLPTAIPAFAALARPDRLNPRITAA